MFIYSSSYSHAMARKTINIDAGVLQEFREFVFERHGQLYGKLSEEATSALRAYMRTPPAPP